MTISILHIKIIIKTLVFLYMWHEYLTYSAELVCVDQIYDNWYWYIYAVYVSSLEKERYFRDFLCLTFMSSKTYFIAIFDGYTCTCKRCNIHFEFDAVIFSRIYN